MSQSANLDPDVAGSVVTERQGPKPNELCLEDYDYHEGPGGALLLKPRREHGETRVRMAGEIIGRMTVLEVLNMVAQSNWRGELHVHSGDHQRVLMIDQGALKHAHTNADTERLGQLLIEDGVLTEEALLEALGTLEPGERLGYHLVESGVVAQDTLFKYLQKQAEEVFYSCLLVNGGSYWFVMPDDQAPSPATTVHLPVQSLLMEGVQRIDEMALYRERIPDNDLYPVTQVEDSHQRDKRDDAMQAVFDLADGTRDISTIARVSGLGEFPTVKAVYQLLRANHVSVRRTQALDADAARRMVHLFNEIMRDIFIVVATYGRMDNARQGLTTWLENGPHAPIVGTWVDIDGTLDPDEVLMCLGQTDADDPLKALHQTLHELAAYALFTACSGLPRQEEQALARDVNARLKTLML